MSDTPPVGDAPKPTPPSPAPEPESTEPAHLPADHPLVKAFAAQKDEIRTLRDKARRFDEIEEASKTAEEKAAERLAAAEKAAAAAEARATRREVALDHKLSKEDAALLDSISDEDTMRAFAARLAPSDEPGRSRTPKPDATQGRSGSAGPTSAADSFADFFRSNLPER